MIVRWGLDELPGVLEELSVRDPLLVSTERWRRRRSGRAPVLRSAAARGGWRRAGGDLGERRRRRIGGARWRQRDRHQQGGLERNQPTASRAAPTRLREYGVPREDLETLSNAVAERAPAKANPRPAPPEAIKQLLEEIW